MNKLDPRGLMIPALLFWITASGICLGGAPEYMKLEAEKGLALEIEGTWDTGGIFVADEIQPLPRPRNPKLRGNLTAVDVQAQTILLYGQTIAVTDETEFVRDGGVRFSIKDLKPGRRLEVSCKVDSAGQWRARKIRAHGVKTSDKIKGTISRVQIDGEPPDTISISGLLILLVRSTDIIEPRSEYFDLERELFGDLARSRPSDLLRGWTLSERLHVAADYRLNASDHNEYDLTTSVKTDLQTTEHQVRLGVGAYFNSSWRAFGLLRVLGKQHPLQERAEPPEKVHAHFLHLFLLYKPHNQGFAFQVGRQRMRDHREWLFDEYLDAARLYYYGRDRTRFEMAVIRSRNAFKTKIQTWTDVVIRGTWYPVPENRFEAYVFARSDSDTSRNRQPVWWGVRYLGQPHDWISAWSDMAIMRGQDKQRSLSAWAFDVGATLKKQSIPYQPALTLGFAAASGGKSADNLTDNRFRQTGYEDNNARLGGVGRTKYYGNLLDPELSNLMVWTFAVAFRPLHRSSIEVLYHSYRQHTTEDDFKGSDLVDPPARPNGVSPDIGRGLDFVVRLPRVFEAVTLKWTLALFKPGEAFAPRQETAVLNKLDLRIAL